MNLNAINQTASMWGYKPTGVTKDASLNTAAPVQGSGQSDIAQDLAPVQAVRTASSTTASWNLATSLSSQMQAMTSGASAPVSTNTSLPDLYQFDNRYLYSDGNNIWAKIDTVANGDAIGDGVWAQDELQAYADAYYNATGKTLNVADLMDKYANNSGVIDHNGQRDMYADDALGISYVKDELLRAEMGISSGTAGSSSSPQVNQKALDSFVTKYTYGYPGKLYANVDQNNDGVWTKDELMSYFKAYSEATGREVDGEALFAKYDRDANGYLTYTEMNEMYRDDALGLSHIKDLLDAESSSSGDKNTSTGQAANKGGSDRLYHTLMDMWGAKFSSSELRQLSTAFTGGMQKAAMLDAFSVTNSVINYGGYWGKGSGFGGTYSHWMAGNIAMLNMFV